MSGCLRNISVFEEIIDRIFSFQVAFFSFLIDVTIINHNIYRVFGRLVTLFYCIFGCLIAFLYSFLSFFIASFNFICNICVINKLMDSIFDRLIFSFDSFGNIIFLIQLVQTFSSLIKSLQNFRFDSMPSIKSAINNIFDGKIGHFSGCLNHISTIALIVDSIDEPKASDKQSNQDSYFNNILYFLKPCVFFLNKW